MSVGLRGGSCCIQDVSKSREGDPTHPSRPTSAKLQSFLGREGDNGIHRYFKQGSGGSLPTSVIGTGLA